MSGGRGAARAGHPSATSAEPSPRVEELSSYENSCAGDESAGRAVRDVLNRIGDKWSLLVIATLRSGRLRFTELRRHIPGISHRMLTLTLRQLERDGLVARSVYAEVPPRVEYELTDLGRTLVELAIALGDWATEHHPAIEASRAAYDARRAAE